MILLNDYQNIGQFIIIWSSYLEYTLINFFIIVSYKEINQKSESYYLLYLSINNFRFSTKKTLRTTRFNGFYVSNLVIPKHQILIEIRSDRLTNQKNSHGSFRQVIIKVGFFVQKIQISKR